jgi:bifunctional UDP-N-acetylglucosamine pyrophosphorylase / glucosamine-1-phosphate N-acetyltransferase
MKTASLILAAGRGSRMKGYGGNKTLLPLIPGKSPYEGTRPILLHMIDNLPPGPKAVVVHHRKEEVIEATRNLGITPCEQEVLNGTGGALFAARGFLEAEKEDNLIITMGDVPLVKRETYEAMVRGLKDDDFVVLGFRPDSKKRYGLLETDGRRVKRIVEWKYWQGYSTERMSSFEVCNSGIYAARVEPLLSFLPVLQSTPHAVRKEIAGKETEFQEFFLTDLIELMDKGGLRVGYLTAQDEREVMGVDDLEALRTVQEIFAVTPGRKRTT